MVNKGYIWFLLLATIGFAACKSPHKLSEVAYTDLGQGSVGYEHPLFPSEIADSLGWGSLASPEYTKVNEEFRVAISSETYPFHLFRIMKGRRVEGENVLYWPKVDSTDAFMPQQNMEDYLSGTCSEIKSTSNFEYCVPELQFEVNWGGVFNRFEQNKVWTLPDQSVLDVETASEGNAWNMNIQVRLKEYYRTFHHVSPDQYNGIPEAVNLLAISSQLRTVTDTFLPPENFDIYQGITSGVRGTKFTLCDKSETWRFNGNLAELLTRNGFPTASAGQDSLLFYVSLRALVADEWYANRNTGFSKVITPYEVNSFSIVSREECPVMGY